MPVPLAAGMRTLVRFMLRPINNHITAKFKHIHGKQDSRMFFFFVKLGNFFNRFEVGMNRIIIQ